jgi:hypothetical protein
MRGCAAIAAFLLAGCDLVFQVEIRDPTIDEDADGVANVDDNCPGITNPGQEDGGESLAAKAPDGVGDACDPVTDSAGDAIGARYFFNDPGDAAGWTMTGAWLAGDGFLEVDARNGTATLASPALATVTAGMTAEAGFEVLELGSGGFGACTDFPERCAEVVAGTPPQIVVINMTTTASDTIEVALPERTVVQLRRISISATDTRADLDGFIRNLNDVDKSSMGSGSNSGSVFVVVDHAWVRLHHVIVYTRP